MLQKLEHHAVVDAAVRVHEKVAKTLHLAQPLPQRLGDHSRLQELLEEVVFRAREAETQTGHKQAADIDGTLDGDLQKPLAGSSLLNLLVVLERRGRNRAQFFEVPVQRVKAGQDALTVEH